MCKAIKEIRKEEFEAGREEGRREGWEEGRQETTKNGLNILMDSLGISLEQAMDIWKLPEDERAIYRKK